MLVWSLSEHDSYPHGLKVFRHECQQICQSLNLPVEMGGGKSAGRLSDCHQICQTVNLPADLVTVMADLVTVTIPAGRFPPHFCQQKYPRISASFEQIFSRRGGRRMKTEVFHTKDQ